MALTDKLTNIANAIRSKTGKTEEMTLDQMVVEIESISGEGGGTVDHSREDNLLLGNFSEYTNPRVTETGVYSLAGNIRLTTVNLPNVTKLGDYTFSGDTSLHTLITGKLKHIGTYGLRNCSSLPNIDMTEVETIGSYGCHSCDSMTEINLPKVERIETYTFGQCNSLIRVDLGAANYLGSNAFSYCSNLRALIIRTTDFCTMSNKNALTGCYHILGTTNVIYNPEGLADGFIYVPDELVNTYKLNSVWGNFADQIKPLSEYDPAYYDAMINATMAASQNED